MTKNEFLQLQNEFAEKAYNYDRIYKRGLILDGMYTVKFFDLICQQIKLSEENKMLDTCLKMHYQDHAEPSAIQKYVDECRESYQSIINNFTKRKQYAEMVVNHTNAMTDDDKRELEEVYKEFTLKNHPGVRMKVTKEFNDLYAAVRKFYNENNLTGILAVLEMNDQMIKVPFEVNPNEYDTFKDYYYNASNAMNQDLAQRTVQYPYTLEEVFEDEITMAREIGEVRSDITRFQEINSKFHQDFLVAFEYTQYIDKK